jgi:hypothetical protein
LIAVGHDIPPAIGGDMKCVLGDHDAAKMRPEIIAQELVVVARNIDEPRSLAGLPQELLDDVVVRLRPVPAGAQLPSVDDVADQIDGVGVMMAKEIQQLLGLACARAEMHIGNEQRANMSRCFGHVHDAKSPSVVIASTCARSIRESYLNHVTAAGFATWSGNRRFVSNWSVFILLHEAEMRVRPVRIDRIRPIAARCKIR